ncbi:hypothetical protein MRX96_005602 [Rhipicephalus microplus]
MEEREEEALLQTPTRNDTRDACRNTKDNSTVKANSFVSVLSRSQPPFRKLGWPAGKARAERLQTKQSLPSPNHRVTGCSQSKGCTQPRATLQRRRGRGDSSETKELRVGFGLDITEE